MVGTVSVSRSVAVVALTVVLVASFGGGTATYALLTDSTAADTETITLAKKNDGKVDFNQKCDQVEVTVSDPNDYEFTIYTTGGDSKVFDETNTSPNGNNVVKVKAKDHFGNQATFDNLTMDGTTYEC